MNRKALLTFAKEQYGTEPEYPWVRFPAFAVLRHAENRKCYAFIMNVPRAKLGLPGEDEADIVNVKCGAAAASLYRGMPGILPAWHMRTDAWVSVLLDGTVPKEEVETLLERSFDLTAQKILPGRAKQT